MSSRDGFDEFEALSAPLASLCVILPSPGCSFVPRPRPPLNGNSHCLLALGSGEAPFAPHRPFYRR